VADIRKRALARFSKELPLSYRSWACQKHFDLAVMVSQGGTCADPVVEGAVHEECTEQQQMNI
jgi:hypothetical protein